MIPDKNADRRSRGRPFEFSDVAVPEEMPLGRTRRLMVHKLVGGQRVVDVLGADPTDPKPGILPVDFPAGTGRIAPGLIFIRMAA